jgi:Cu/Ag efflux pump CusA
MQFAYTIQGISAIGPMGQVLRLRPIMMTTLVATLGLIPAAMSHAIGSDSQRPFAIVIVGGLMVAMVMFGGHSSVDWPLLKRGREETLTAFE